MRLERWLCSMGLAACLLLLAGAAEAAPLDGYRDMLASRSFTLKYQVLEQDTEDIRNMFHGHEGLVVSVDEKGAQRAREEYERNNPTPPLEIFVMDGDNRYTEMQGRCKLLKDGQVFTFFRFHQKGRYEGMHISKHGGLHRDEVMPGENIWTRSPFRTQAEIEDIGNPLLARMLAAIYPVAAANAALPTYAKATEGTLPDGSSYEDHAGERDGRFYAVRCYFRAGKLTKMSYAAFAKDGERSRKDYEKYSIRIEEFSAVPEQRYLALPEGLKVVNR